MDFLKRLIGPGASPHLHHHHYHPSDTMLLFCWVFGDTRAFPVEISPGKTVGELKEAIVAKKPHRFRDIDADSLALWKKIILESDRETLQPSDLEAEDELHTTWRIGEYFEEPPPKKRIHIIIKAPETADVQSKSK